MLQALLIVSVAILTSCASSKPTADKASEGSSANKAAATPTEKNIEKKTAAKTADKNAENKKAESGSNSESLAESTKISCTYDNVKRDLAIHRTAEGCTVEYTKDGTTQEIGSGAPNSNFCSEMMEQVKNKLTGAGYTCN